MDILFNLINYTMGGWQHIFKAAGAAFGIFTISWLLYIFTNDVDGYCGTYVKPKTNGFTIFTYLCSATGLACVLLVCAVASFYQLKKDFSNTSREMQTAVQNDINEMLPEETKETLKEIKEETGYDISKILSFEIK